MTCVRISLMGRTWVKLPDNECEHSGTGQREFCQVTQEGSLRCIEEKTQGCINAVWASAFVPIQFLADECLLGAHMQMFFCMSRSDRTFLQNSQYTLAVQCLPYGMSPLMGLRLGEAKHPGPEQAVTFAFFNPTTIWGKDCMVDQMPAQVWFAAETAANSTVQKAMNYKFRSRSIKAVWSKPTLSRDEPLTENESVRGKASGTLILSRFPARLARHTFEIPEEFATRIVSAIVQVHSVQIHCISIYGFCLSQPKARQRTDRMLQFAAKLMDDVALPTLIAGDFNHELQKLEGWQYFLERGYQSTAQLHQDLHFTKMPPTYRQATCNDQFLVPPQLTRFISGIEVRSYGEFAGHNPVMLQMQLPLQTLYRHVLKVPKPFHHFGLQQNDIDFQYRKTGTWSEAEAKQPHMLANGFSLWAKRVENAVHQAIRAKHMNDPLQFPQKALPPAYRGRCSEITLKKQAWARSTKHAWKGQFMPLQETISCHFAKHVKQLRRIQSLRSRLEVCTRTAQFDRYQDQLQAEWQAILNASGFTGGFRLWILSKPELAFVPDFVPDLEYLFLLEQFLLHQCKDLDQQEKRARKMTKRFDQWKDRKLGHRTRMFQNARGSSLPPVEMLTIDHLETVHLLEQYSGLVVISKAATTCLVIGQQVSIHGQAAEVIDVKQDSCELMVEDELPIPLLNAQLGYKSTIQQPQLMADALHDFWATFWNRDQPEEQFRPEVWAEFQQFLHNVPHLDPIELPHLRLEAWREAVRSMKSSSSPGVCGWVVDDLKLLPDAAVEDLSMLFWAHMQEDCALPKWLLQVRTIPLAKMADKSQPNTIRPISIYATLYRWWARVLTHAILVQWASQMPPALIGYVPQRNMEHAMWKMQYEIELQYDLDLPPIGGLTLDIIKAFNALPRLPTFWCMEKCGVPTKTLNFIQRNLRVFTRTWTVHGSVILPSAAHPTTTGMPEGDSWSVIAMTAMSLAWGMSLEARGAIRTTLFADNWTWRSQTPQKHAEALHLTQTFMRTTRLQVDWAKSWAWATGENHKNAWKDLLQASQGAIKDIPIKNHAKDLGHHLSYAKVLSRETFETRKVQGLAMLKKLQSDWFDLDDTAHIIKVAVFPKIFFGSTISAIGDNHFRDIRSAVAQAYLKGTGHPNPYLAAVLPSAAAEDPEFFVLKLSLRHARSIVITMSQQEQRAFFRQVATHPKEKNLVRGPAGALACYFSTIGVHMDCKGNMHVSAFGEIHLLNTNWCDIVSWLEYAWALHLQTKLHSRDAWTALPLIDFRETAKLFASTPMSQRKHVLIDLTGANLINKRKAKFDAEQSKQCLLCNQEEDSMMHRVLHCNATASVRQPYQEHLNELLEIDESHIHLPVKFLHPFAEWKTWVQCRFPSMVPSAEGQEYLRCMLDRGICPDFYTDGSCDLPTKPQIRSAAYSVILSLDLLPGHAGQFHVMGVAECPGRQAIARAELAALIAALKLAPVARIFTDCQNVVDLCNKCRLLPDIRLMHMHPSFDLVKELWYLLRAGRYQIEKIKAHRALAQATTHAELIGIAGNMKADLAAKVANEKFRKQRALATDVEEEKREVQLLLTQWKLRHSLLVEKAKADQGITDMYKPEGASTGQTLPQIFREWTVPEPNRCACFSTEEIAPLVLWSLWGTAYTRLLLSWLATLWWPPVEHQPISKRYGISWFELTCNFMITTGRLPAVNVGPTGGQLDVVQLEWDRGPTEAEVTFTTIVRGFRNALLHMDQLAGHGLLPLELRSRVDTLYAMGAGSSAHGFKVRPMMQRQQCTVKYVQDYFRRVGHVHTWTCWPTKPHAENGSFPLQYEECAEDQIDFRIRHARWKAARRG